MTDAAGTLTRIADWVWVDTGPSSVLGMRLTSTMTVLRLGDGSLLIYSPIALTPARRAAVEAIGPVAHLYAPNLFHHLSIGDWAAAFASAMVHAPSGLAKKRPDLRIDRFHHAGSPPALDRSIHNTATAPVLDGTVHHSITAAALDETIDEVRIDGCRLEETVLFHRPSRTLVVADLVHNIGRPTHRWTALYTRAMGFYDRVALSRMIRWTAFNDRDAARRSIDAVLALPFDRVIVGHGAVLEIGSREALQAAYRWLPRSRHSGLLSVGPCRTDTMQAGARSDGAGQSGGAPVSATAGGAPQSGVTPVSATAIGAPQGGGAPASATTGGAPQSGGTHTSAAGDPPVTAASRFNTAFLIAMRGALGSGAPPPLSEAETALEMKKAEALFWERKPREALTVVQRLMVLSERVHCQHYLLRAMLQGALGNDAFYYFDMSEVLARRDEPEFSQFVPEGVEREIIEFERVALKMELAAPEVLAELKIRWLASAHYAVGFDAASNERLPEAVFHFVEALLTHVSALALWYLGYVLRRMRRFEEVDILLDELDRCSPESMAELLRGVSQEEIDSIRATVKKILSMP